MRNLISYIAILLFSFTVASAQSKGKEKIAAAKKSIVQTSPKPTNNKSIIPIDNAIVGGFFKRYPNLKKYQSGVTDLYKKRNYKSIWYNNKGLIEFANLLHSKTNQLEEEGLKSSLAYKDKIDGIFNKKTAADLSRSDTELMLSSMFLFYAKKVYKGIDPNKIREIGWLLPIKDISYENLLNSLLVDPKLLSRDEKQLFVQYYKLRDVLKKYRQIEQNGDWKPITTDSLIKGYKEYKPNDNSKTIGQIRQRLYVTGDLKQDSKSNLYDPELMTGILNYKKRNGYNADYIITPSHIRQMNTPIEKYIKTIIVNMERCRWIAPELTKADRCIIINIPSFKLFFKRNGKTEFESNIFVGETMNETVIFSSNMTHLVFAPYWNIPRSIIETELEPAMAKDKNYLAHHNMEWNNGNIRQKPGPENPLGVVKFIFPNSNDIYLHDTPSKSLFKSEYRAYSHGCINLDKAKELAFLILKDDRDWPVQRINKAMTGTKETICILKKKIPVHIGYLTAWVNDSGEISFYNDIYERDDRLAALLFSEDSK